MAKSVLEAHGISCTLADENANVYGGAPFAMPVRLLVNEEQSDEAQRILDTGAHEFVSPEPATQEENSMSNDMSEILNEVKRLRNRIETYATLVLIAVIISVGSSLYRNYFSSSSSRNEKDTWRPADAAMDRRDYDTAAAVVQRLIARNPDYYYGYLFLGFIDLERNELIKAERHFSQAYELFPTAENEQKLRAVQKRLVSQ